jgi:hypothetical protein
LFAAGTPGPLGRSERGFCFFCFFLFFLAEPLEVVELLVVCGRDEVRWSRLGWLGRGAEVLLEVVVLEDEPELEVDPEVLEEAEPELVVVGLELVVVVGLELVVVVGLELVVVVGLELVVVVGLELEVAPLVVVVVEDDVVTGAHASLSDTTTPWTGRFMAEIGVPGATFTLNV